MGFRLFLVRLVLCLMVFLADNNLSAQCSAAGNLLGNDFDFYNRGKKTFTTGLNYRYNFSDNLYQGCSRIETVIFERSDFNYLELAMSCSMTSRWMLRAEFGYFLNKTEYYNNGFAPAGARGVGDLSLLLNYQISRKGRLGTLVAGTGVKLPVVEFDQEVDHVRLPQFAAIIR